MADLIGVSVVHLNGILQELRADGVILLASRRLRILDHGALCELAGVRRWRQAEPNWLPDAK